MFDHGAEGKTIAAPVGRWKADRQRASSRRVLQLFDGDIGADEGIVVQDEQVGVGEE